MSRDKYRRRPSMLPIRDKVLIMCSGKTEENYFNHFKDKHKRNLQNVSVKVVTYKKSNPMAVVRAALSHKADYDEVWAVFDKNDFTNFDDAIKYAIKKGIKCAFSNIAIEYWFYLHFENKTGAISRSVLDSELGKRLNLDYDKSAEAVQRVCNKICNKLIIAEERAQIGHERHIVTSGPNPSGWCSCTTIYALTRRLREWSQAKKVR